MNNLTKILIITVALSMSSAKSFSNCYKYMEGSVGGKYPIIVKRNNDRDTLEYMYQSQIKSQNYIELEQKSDHLVEIVNGRQTKNILNLSVQTKDYGLGVWENTSKKIEYSFEFGLNTEKYIKVYEYLTDSNSIEVFRRQIGQNEFVLAVSVNKSKIIPVVISDCSRPFNDSIGATLLNSDLGLWKITADSIGMGGGNYYLSVSAVVKVGESPELLAWTSRESGGSGVSYRESIVTDYSIEGSHLVYSIEKEIYQSTQEKTEINTVRNEYKYEFNNTITPAIWIERVSTTINQEVTLNEVKEFEVGSDYPRLLEDSAEGYPGILY